MNISKLLKKYNYCDSPYIFYDVNGMPAMYFTVYENDKWQLYFTNNKEVQKVDFLQEYSIEQVTCFKKQDLYCVSFCAKMGDVISLFYAETKDPNLFKIITSIAHNIKAGVVTPNKIFIIEPDNSLSIYKNKPDIIIDNEKPIKKLFFDFNDPTEVTFLNGDEDHLLISYRDIEYKERCGTIYVDLNNLKDQKQILTENNEPLYDVTIDPLTHLILYCKNIGLKNYQRKIAKTFLKNINSKEVYILKNNK